MSALTSWFIRNPVAANLIMLLILVSGVLTLTGIRIEGFPKLPPSSITISTTFGNAYAKQVDEQITQKIELALEGQDGVKKVTSTSINGLSTVRVEKNEEHDLQRLLDDVRLRIDGIETLPKAADRSSIFRDEFDFPALYILIDGETDARSLQKLSKKLKAALLEQPEISRLRLLGEKESEIRIETNPAILEKYDLTIADITQKIQESSLLFESGLLKTEGAYISLRADSQAYYKTEFASIPIINNTDGTRILLGDIASIKDTYRDDEVIVRFNGRPAIGMELLVGQKENLLVIARVVQQVILDIQPQLPPEVTISTFGDSSIYISDRLNLLKNNAIQGLALVVFLLALFLNLKLAFWVGMGIPISVAGAIAVMGTKWIDYSLNDITTFGLIIALGILVDDAVVVGESVFNERKKNKDAITGTEIGVRRVSTATIFGVLTTVAAFSPMLLLNNELGKILGTFSGVVILALLFSLFESKFILPAHLASIDIDDDHISKYRISRYWKLIQATAQNTLYGFRDRLYAPAVEWAIKQRYAVLILFITIAVVGIGLIANGKVKSVFFPEIPGQVIRINVEMDARAPYRLNIDNMDKIERIGNEVNRYYVEQGITESPPIHHILKVVSGAYQGEIYAELTPSVERENADTMSILHEWQKRVGTLEGVIDLSFSGSDEIAGGFAIQLFSKDELSLNQASKEVIGYLSKIEGVRNLRDSLKGGQPEIHLTLKPEAQHLGFNAQDLAIQISNRFGGAEAQRVQRNNGEVKVLVQNNEQARKTLDDLMQTRLKSQNGDWYPLLSVAQFTSSYASGYIERRNGKRVNNVQAFIDKSIVSSEEVSQSLFETLIPELEQKYPSVEVKMAGELEEMDNIKGGLIRSLIITSLLIYGLMAIPLKSYTQPFIIMSVIPFGFVGATLGHLIMDVPLSLLSFFGMLALTGIVVNDSLVMMTRYNESRAEGDDVPVALKKAGVGRFQAIFLTTVTTVAGLTPLLLETSEQAQYLIPAAISLAFGEIFATVITLILIPVLIAIKEDFRKNKNNSLQ